MASHHDLEESFAALIEESRRTLGDPPSAEELLAYHRGELSGKDAERIREHLAHDPETLDRLLDLAAYTGSPGDPDHLSDEELDEDWQAISSRLRLPRRSKVVRRPSPAPWQWVERGLAIAAVFAVAVLGLRVWTLSQRVGELSRQLTEPRVNEARYELLPDGRRGGPAVEPSIRISLVEGGAHLTLALFDRREYEGYRLEIGAAGSPDDAEPLWSTRNLIRRADNAFELSLSAAFLPPGEYVFRLFGVSDRDELLATYSVRFGD